MDDLMTIEQFGAKIKTKYPAYASFSDVEIGQKMLAKYPQYSKKIKQTTKEEPTSFADNLAKTKTNETGLKGVATGVAKSGLGFITGLGQLVSKPLSYLPGKAGEFFKGGAEYGKELQTGLLAGQTPSEKAGKIIGDIAQFFIPASKVAKAENAIGLMLQGSSKLQALGKTGKVLTSLGKVGAATTLSGVTTGGITAAQTGSYKEGLQAAKTGAILSGGLKTVGETVRVLKIPESAYNRIFKENYQNIKAELRPEVIAGIKKTNPELYKQYIKSGAIKEIGGVPTLNENMAKQALDRGLKGSVNNMTKELIADNIGLEHDIITTMKNKNISFRFNPEGEHKNLIKVLKDVVDDYADVGNAAISDEAKKYLAFVSKGKVPGKVMLDLRRFLDGMRIRTSYSPTAKLSLGQESLKYWTDTLRDRIAKTLPNVGSAMKDYSFNIKAIDALAKEAVRTGNKQAIGLIDSIFLGSAALGEQTIASVGLARRVLQSPTITTRISQGIVAPVTRTGAAVKAGLSRGISSQID